jgi:multicomponent K+:H+ antiporter subunit A
MLAYSTVSHLGLMTMLFGFGTPMAAVAGVFHIINHATFKAALFMNAGIVDHEAGTRDIKRLGGLLMLMPITATMAMVAAASMAGLPPLNGFLSKEMMLEEAAHTVWAGNFWAVPALATLGAVLSVAYSFRYIVHVFFGPKRTITRSPSRTTRRRVVAAAGAAGGAGGADRPVPRDLRRDAGACHGRRGDRRSGPGIHLSLWHGVTPALICRSRVVGGLILLWRYRALRAVWRRVRIPRRRPCSMPRSGSPSGGSRA